MLETKTMKLIYTLLVAVILTACQEAADDVKLAATPESEKAKPAGMAAGDSADRLSEILDAQPPEFQARYRYRHPRETLEFFGVEPGMTVVEGLPGSGWYTKILLPYLGPDGHLVGANYSMEMWPLFQFANEEFLNNMSQWKTAFATQAKDWGGPGSADVSAFYFGTMDDALAGTADAVLFIRVLHNLARFNDEGGFLDAALSDVYTALKPGGSFGVVQHEARGDMPDDWANGANGYLKKQFVIDTISAAGFEYVAESDINANPKDQPTTEDIVWRLPPAYFTSREDPELKSKYEAIGESNRMTLLFRKPE